MIVVAKVTDRKDFIDSNSEEEDSSMVVAISIDGSNSFANILKMILLFKSITNYHNDHHYAIRFNAY